ncbi:MAG TPA: extracellular solute-binding protein [Phototrophicaceae bacterium]|nr:extracellular solute-binding protein [Phototrophicaceae bacterium]
MFRINKTLFVLLIALLLMSSGVVHAQEDVTLTLWTHDGLYVEFFTARAEEWKETHPDINFTFDFQVIPDITTVVLANIAAGEPLPDILGIEQGDFPAYMRDNIIADNFLDLTDRIGDNYDLIAEGRWSLYNHQGGIYGVDSGLSTAAYYYQPALLEAAGLEAVPETWEAFLEAGAQAFQNTGIHLSWIASNPDIFQLYYLQRGGQIFDEQGNFVFGEPENREKAIEVLNMWREGIDNGTFATFLAPEMFGPTPIEAYHSGTIAGSVQADWYGTYILEPQAEDMAGQWRLAPMPAWADGEGTGTSVWGGTGFAVNKNSPHADLAWELIEYSYLTYENQVKRFEEIGYFPTMIEAASDPRVTGLEAEFYGGQKIGEIWAATVTEVPVWYQSPYRQVWMTAVDENMPLFFDGSMAAEELVDLVVTTVEDEIAFDS